MHFDNFFSDAESADISALDADDFTDVTLAKVTLLMLLWSVRIVSSLRLIKSSWLPVLRLF